MGKILYIINILRNFSCKEHPLSITQITELSNRYYDPSGNKDFINEVTTRRALTSYLRESQILNDMPEQRPSSSLNTVFSNLNPALSDTNYQHANYKIHILFENPNPTSEDDTYIDVTNAYANPDYEFCPDCDSPRKTAAKQSRHSKNKSAEPQKRKKEPKAFYYYEPFLPTEEIANLINIIESHPYYTSNEVLQISSALRSIAPAYFRDLKVSSHVNDELRSDDSTLQYNLHELHHLISEKKDIIIEYSYYNEKKELIPHTGYPLQVTPYRILWSNGYCYLAAYNSYWDNITHYRVDRITSIAPAPKGKKADSHFEGTPVKHTIQYAKEHPVMMSGDTISVSLLCRKSTSIINRLLDSFGKEISIRPANATLLQQIFPNHPDYKPEDWLNITCDNINPDGAALWAKQYCTECVLYAPADLAQTTKEELLSAARNYPEKPH